MHHRLVKIHPFPNGNGRWARIAADVFLTVYFGPLLEFAGM
jgi:Fic family protein